MLGAKVLSFLFFGDAPVEVVRCGLVGEGGLASDELRFIDELETGEIEQGALEVIQNGKPVTPIA